MSTVENASIQRRVDALAEDVADVRLVFVRVTFVVCGRGVERLYLTAQEVIDAAGDEPPVVELERIDGPRLLVDRLTGERWLRHTLDAEGQAAFDIEADGAELVDVEIKGHAKQILAIRSRAPLVVARGGNRSGKSMVQVWRLFLRWVLRGHGALDGSEAALFWWVAPDLTRAINNGLFLLAGPHALGGGKWPDRVFSGLSFASAKAKGAEERRMIDGSRLAFLHANTRGEQAGDNLKSVNVTDAVVDELAAVPDQRSWDQVNIRTIQTGGSVTTGTTPKPSKAWVRLVVDEEMVEAGAALEVTLSMVDNPWISFAALFMGFLKDRTLTKRQLELDVLPYPEDYLGALQRTVTSKRALREHFGLELGDERKLWTEWREDLIYSGPMIERGKSRRSLWIERDGRAVEFLNITPKILARYWARQRDQGRVFARWLGLDFNYHARSIVFELYGEGETVDKAIANASTWILFAVDEVESTGTTMAHAAKVRERFGPMPVWCDPHGKKGDARRGTSNDEVENTDVQAFRAEGFPVQPANDVDSNGRFIPLSRTDSCNVMHALMRDGRLLVHEGCTGLIDAFRNDETVKRSSTDSPSDLRSGYSDAARYGAWPIFRGILGARLGT